MNTQVGKVLIGKDIDGTALATLVIGGSTDSIAEGELVVLDKNKKILASGKTYNDTDVIYIVEGLGTTYSYVNEAGTAVTGVQKLLYSDAIQGAAVTEYSGRSYTAPVEEVWNIDLTGWVPVVNTEYRIKIIYKDIYGHPGQVSKTYSLIAGTATLDTEGAAFAAVINADPDRRVNATYTTGTDVLALTAIAYDDDNELSSESPYSQVSFEVFLTSDNYNTLSTASANAISVTPYAGDGYWKQVRDEEKWVRGYEGVLNNTAFPVIAPALRTVKDQTYDCIVIKSKNWFTTPDRREQQVDITTKVFLPDSAGQTAKVLSVLNPWMESTPRGLSSISL
jgi:hypothetical protein